MASDNALFEAQKQEFANFTDIYHEKVTRMYQREVDEGNETFDDKIHAIWDIWDVSKRAEFIQIAFKQYVIHI